VGVCLFVAFRGDMSEQQVRWRVCTVGLPMVDDSLVDVSPLNIL
jgi:hypothetical protein